MGPFSFELFLERIYEATGIGSQVELASALGINRSAITQAKKKGAIPEKWLFRLSRVFGLDPVWLESGDGEKFLRGADGRDDLFEKVPKVKARLCAGGGSFEVGGGIEGFYSFRNDWLRKKGNPHAMVLMDVFGNSMEPELRDGDTVLIDGSQKSIIAGAVYAVGIEDTVMVKRVEKHPHTLVLVSDNAGYAPLRLKGEEADAVRIIGKVLWVCRELR